MTEGVEDAQGVGPVGADDAKHALTCARVGETESVQSTAGEMASETCAIDGFTVATLFVRL